MNDFDKFDAPESNPFDRFDAPEKKAPPKKKRSKSDFVSGFMANVNRGLSIGDELAAAGNVVGGLVTGRHRFGTDKPGNVVANNISMLGDAFKTELAHQRETEDAFAAERPKTAAFAKGVGMAGTVVAPAGPVVNATTKGGAILKSALGAAVPGYAYAFADRGSIEERAKAGNIGAVAGGVLGGAFGAFAPVPRKAAPEAATADDFARVDVDPMLAVSGSKTQQMVGQGLAGNVLVGAPLREAAERTTAQTGAAAERIAQGYGSATNPVTAGGALQRGAEASAKRMKAKGGELYNATEPLERSTDRLPVAKSTEALDAAFAKFTTPAMKGWLEKRAGTLKSLQDALKGSDGTITFAEMKELRSQVGAMMDDPELIGSGEQRVVKQIYSALSEDMVGAARTLGGEDMAQSLLRADKYWSAIKTREQDTLRSVFKADSPEKAYTQALALATSKGGRADISKLARLRRSLNDDEWGEFASGVINQMGRDGDSNFSAAKFYSAYANLSPEGRRAIFGTHTEGAKDLAALAKVAKTQVDAGKFYNNSQSGNAAANFATASAHGAAGTAALMGNPAPLAGLLALDSLGYGASKLLASPGFARMVMRGNEVKDAKAAAALMQELNTYAGRNPQVSSLVQSYAEQLERTLGTRVASRTGAEVPPKNRSVGSGLQRDGAIAPE